MFMRYLNGVKMIEDLLSSRVHLWELIMILAFAFLPYESLLDIFFSASRSNLDPLPYEWFACLLLLATMLYIALSLEREDRHRFVEIFLCLYFVTNITAYVFYIPFILLLKFVLSFFTHNKFDYEDYLLLIYFPAYMFFSAFIWRKKRASAQRLTKTP